MTLHPPCYKNDSVMSSKHAADMNRYAVESQHIIMKPFLRRSLSTPSLADTRCINGHGGPGFGQNDVITENKIPAALGGCSARGTVGILSRQVRSNELS